MRKPAYSRKNVRKRRKPAPAPYARSRSFADTSKMYVSLDTYQDALRDISRADARADYAESQTIIYKTYKPSDPYRKMALDYAKGLFNDAMRNIESCCAKCVPHLISGSRNRWKVCPHH